MGKQKQSSVQSNPNQKPTESTPKPKESPMQAVKTAKPETQYRTFEYHDKEHR